MSLAAAHALYGAMMVACVIIVYVFPVFDLRGIGRFRRRIKEPHRDEMDFDAANAQRAIDDLKRAAQRAERLAVIPRADIVLLCVAGGVFGLMLTAGAGFLAPRWISEFYGVGTSDWAPWGETIIERGAQMFGALAAALIGLRMYLGLIGVAILGGATFFVLTAINYALDGRIGF
jgi:hypothetical protein